jgi:alpha-glucosidase (family GH31 glycosyl hydrolase)
MPLFVRAGSIVPTGPVKQYVTELSAEPVRLTVYPGADGRFQLYDDDGLSFAYENGAFGAVDLRWDNATQTLHYSVIKDGLLPVKELMVSLAGGGVKRITPRQASQTIQL